VKRALAGATLLMCGCATADAGDVPTLPSDGGATDAAVDTAPSRDATEPDVLADVIFPIEDTGPKGICETPAGTTITGSGAYMSTPQMAIDGKLDTVWNSGGYTGSVRLKFPKAIRFDRVRLAANAVPACDETYTLTGYLAGAPTTLAAATRPVVSAVGWLPTIDLPGGTWDELSIDVAKAASWITLAEVVVFDSTAGCGLP